MTNEVINSAVQLEESLMTPEAKVKEKVRKVLKELNAYYITPATGGYGNSGAPDFIVCYQSRFIGIECKANRNTATKLQLWNLSEIRRTGGTAMIVDENNVDNLRKELQSD